MLDARLDVDQITLRVTRRSMEVAASAYLPQRTIKRQRLSRDELKVLREDAENLRARIAGALAVHINIKNVGPHSYPQPGVDHDRLDATPVMGEEKTRTCNVPEGYFAKLADTLDRQIEKPRRGRGRTMHARPNAISSGPPCWCSGAISAASHTAWRRRTS